MSMVRVDVGSIQINEYESHGNDFQKLISGLVKIHDMKDAFSFSHPFMYELNVDCYEDSGGLCFNKSLLYAP